MEPALRSTGAGLHLVVNASSGPSENDDQLAAVLAALPAVSIARIPDPEHTDEVLANAATGAEVLGVMGGDGTVNAAASAAMEAGVPLLVFPGGTLNHFARDVGIDSVADAIDALRGGPVIDIDVGVIDDRVFVNTASFGFYAELVRERELIEHRIGKWPALTVALAKLMVTSEPLAVTIDGEPLQLWMIFIGNCAYDTAGFVPSGRRDLSDGLLDVRYVRGGRRWARARLLGSMLSGRLDTSEVYRHRLVRELRIDTGEAVADLATDGEVGPGSGEFTVRKERRRLQVIVRARDAEPW